MRFWHFLLTRMDDHLIMLAWRTSDGDLRSVPTASLVLHGLGHSTVGADWSTATPYRNLGHSVYAVLDGEARIAIEGRWQRLTPGHLYAIPGHRQVQRQTRGFTHVHADFTLGSFAEDLHLGQLDRILAWPSASHAPWHQALCAAAAAGAGLAGPAAIALESVLLGAVAAMRHAAGQSAPVASADRAVATALAWLDRHYAHDPSLAEIAAAAGRSPAHLHARFRAVTGRSPTRYALERRMADAQHLLATTDLSVQAVAERCGYADPLHFSRVVRRHCGLSPQHLRRLRGG